MAGAPPKLEECLEALSRRGLLMLQDARLPSVTTIVAGAPVKGSWWGHAHGHRIFNAAQALEQHPDVAVAKLIDGKVTYIHRRLLPALPAVGSAQADWQLFGLSPGAKALLAAVDKRGTIRTDLAAAVLKAPRRGVGKAALELEKRLLVASEEVHTETGAHAKHLESWRVWAARRGVDEHGLSAAEARHAFEGVLAVMNREAHAAAKLPWQARVKSRL